MRPILLQPTHWGWRIDFFFSQLWAELEAEYGVDRGFSNKQIWQEVTLNYEGPLTWNAFYDFWEHFLTLKENVDDASG